MKFQFLCAKAVIYINDSTTFTWVRFANICSLNDDDLVWHISNVHWYDKKWNYSTISEEKSSYRHLTQLLMEHVTDTKNIVSVTATCAT